jgi:hypothetical protein
METMADETECWAFNMYGLHQRSGNPRAEAFELFRSIFQTLRKHLLRDVLPWRWCQSSGQSRAVWTSLQIALRQCGARRSIVEGHPSIDQVHSTESVKTFEQPEL